MPRSSVRSRADSNKAPLCILGSVASEPGLLGWLGVSGRWPLWPLLLWLALSSLKTLLCRTFWFRSEFIIEPCEMFEVTREGMNRSLPPELWEFWDVVECWEWWEE